MALTSSEATYCLPASLRLYVGRTTETLLLPRCLRPGSARHLISLRPSCAVSRSQMWSMSHGAASDGYVGRLKTHRPKYLADGHRRGSKYEHLLAGG